VRTGPGKSGYYVLEGLNSFATAYFFNYVLQRLRRESGFTDMDTLLLCVLHGFLYIPGSVYGGRFGQRFGYFRSLHLGFGGQFVGVVLAGLVPATWAQVAGVAIWTTSMCFVWPMLEALVSEHESKERLPDRVGLYNFTWAATAAVGVFVGGTMYRVLGAASLYWLPALVHLGQWVALPALERKHERWVGEQRLLTSSATGGDGKKERLLTSAATGGGGEEQRLLTSTAHGQLGTGNSELLDQRLLTSAATAATEGVGYFKQLAWLGNPFNYMAINTVLAIVPALSVRLGQDVERMGQLMSIWFVARALAFVVLWKWTGWHYRFVWFGSGLLLLLAGFVGVVLAPSTWVLVVAQVALGWASAVLYYSSLFYTMDGSEAKGEHGGLHEAFIGCGIFGGPAVSALAIWATGSELAPAWAVGAFLFAGFVISVVLKVRGTTKKVLRGGEVE
jgi:MFS family permease